MEGTGNVDQEMSGLAFCPQYRLASYPKSQFPAALQDAVSSYNYLLELGIPATKIIFSGTRLKATWR
jgi:acetyl esterase/lipase